MNRRLHKGCWPAAAAAACLTIGTSSGFAAIQFQDVTSAAGITDTEETYGTGFGDFDGDGYPDIFLNKHQYTDSVLYMNIPNGTGGRRFSDEAAERLTGEFNVLTDSHGMESADWDNDGDTDIMEVTGAGYPFPLWQNDGLGNFQSRVSQLGFTYPRTWPFGGAPPIGGRTPLFLDYTGDGKLDVLVTARDNYPAYRTPTATFRQDTGTTGEPRFVFDESTGVDLTNDAACHYALLAELTGDGVQDIICADSSVVARVWDVTQLPFMELRPVIGDALYNATPADFAVGDFNGDLRTDLFAPASASAQNLVGTVNSQTIHAWFDENVAYDSGFNFTAVGNVTFEFDWWTEPADIFYGAGGTHPPQSSDLRLYDEQPSAGSPHHVQFTLSSAQAQGLAPRDPGQSKGIYIGVVGGRWQVRFSGINSWNVGMVIRAGTSISNLASVGGIHLGQPTNGSPLLFIQNASHQLVNSSSQIQAVNRSCKAAAAGDLDNDGDLDVYVGCVSELSNLENVVYENQGAGTFVPVAGAAGAPGQMPEGRLDTVSLGDYDRDGRLDLLLANGHLFRPFSYAGKIQLYRNTGGTGNHWVQADLVGTTSNADGIGAIVYATTPDGKVQMREQGNGVHKKSQDFKRIHFGLAQSNTVNLEVRWPSGTVDHFNGRQADQIYTLVEGSGGGPSYVLGAGNVSVGEAAGQAVFTVTLAPAPGAGQSVDVSYQTANGSALAGSDYTTAAGSRTFTQGQTQKTVSVPILNDTSPEGSETFGLQLSSASTNAATATATIQDDDSADLPTCGQPVYNRATEAGFFLWNDCGTEQWHVRATTGGQNLTYQGSLTSNPALSSLAAFSFETGDVLPPSFNMIVGGSGQDGFDFSFPAGADLCLSLSAPSGMAVVAGANRIDVGSSVSLPDFGPCGGGGPTLPACGQPAYDKATEAALFVWNDCGTSNWHVRATGGGQSRTYQGSLTPAGSLAGLAAVSFETGDVLPPAYVMNVGGTGQDGFDFSLPAGGVCLALTAPGGVPVLAGSNRVQQTGAVSLPSFAGCTP
jgi:hypothetical protein